MRTIRRTLPAHSAPLVGSLRVDRALPRRELRRVGPFVFLDHFGPIELGPGLSPALDVPAHPHVGLQTVTYLLSGSVRHRDSLGSDQIITPGDVNWMTAGRGIVHAELSHAPETTSTLHGIQTWVALPHAARKTEPAFHHVAAASLPSLRATGVLVRALAGTLDGATSPAPTYSGISYLDVTLDPGASVTLPTERDHVLALYVIEGPVRCGDEEVAGHVLAELEGDDDITLHAIGAARVLILGGATMPEPTVIYWNFIVDTFDEGREREADWEAGRYFPKLDPTP